MIKLTILLLFYIRLSTAMAWSIEGYTINKRGGGVMGGARTGFFESQAVQGGARTGYFESQACQGGATT